MNWMLVVVIMIFISYIIFGSRAGLVKMVAYLASSVVLLLVSTIVSPMVSRMVTSNPKMMGYVENRVEEAYEKLLEQKEKIEQKEKKEIKGKKETSGKKGKKSPAHEGKFSKEVNGLIGKTFISHILVRYGIFILIYALSYIILMIFEKSLCLVAKLPVLNTLNRLGGAAVGGVKGLLVVWILFMVLTLFMEKEWAAVALRQIGENEYLRQLYDNNLIVKAVDSFL